MWKCWQAATNTYAAELERLRRVGKAMEALQKNIQTIKHANTYILCRDSWLAMIEEALKD